MPDFASLISSTPGTIAEEDARVLRAALATGCGVTRMLPPGASGLRMAARLLKQTSRVDRGTGRRTVVARPLAGSTVSH